ncbi:MAG: 5'-nucleotidase C-terminal domain-containing protein [Myxococcales bacterium]|nr:5'-nucleotidase C-terminal domain-containing protein [Myxococcales bacterium]
MTERGPTLRIVAVNDVYSLEHLPRLASLLREAREVAPADRLLVTMAGDFVAPSVLSSLDAGRGMVDCMNALGFTHAVLGNHEDDVPPEELRARVRELEATCLGTNVRGFEPALPVSEVVSVCAPGPAGRSVRVGLVGVVMDDPTAYRRPPFGGVTLLPPNDAAIAEAERLRAAGCATVLALTHQPLALDRALARGWPAFPVLLAGHEHQPSLEREGETWIVKGGADAALAAVIDLAWPAEAHGADAPSVRVALHDVSRFPEDPAVRARVATHMAKVEALTSATLLVLDPGEELTSVGVRARQTSLGTLLASRVRDALGAEVGLFNGGGIRGAATYRGGFSYGHLQTEVPFENEMVVVAVPGASLSAAVQASRARAPVESGGFLQVCSAVDVGPDGQVIRVGGAPLDPARVYRVALVRNLFAGMDRNEPLLALARERPELIPPPDSGRDVKLVLLESFAAGLWRALGGFDAVDADHDGRVDGSELERAIADHTGAPEPRRAAIAAGIVMRALDTDDDERISREEAAVADRLREPPDEPGS